MATAAIFDRTISQIEDRLNLITHSHKLVSNNLANANTPGYQTKEVSFKNYLQESIKEQNVALTTSHDRHLAPEALASAGTRAEVEETGPVSLEREMMKLAKNSVDYQYMVTILNRKFTSLKLAITEGAS
jgi:flagellar basal-body rod protein FlgB